MSKSNSNPLKNFKKVLNDTSNKIVTTYDTVSTQVSTNIAETMPKLTQELQKITGMEILTSPIKNELDIAKIQMKANALVENEKLILPKHNISAFEDKIKPLYKGCYPDDPTNPTMSEYLGTVSSSVECIKLGKMNNLKYVGIQQGDKCYGSNTLPNFEPVDKNTYCSVPCNNPNSGTCGGYYYNQVYTTDTGGMNINFLPKDIVNMELNNKKNVLNTIESFTELNNDISKINLLLQKCAKKQPLNSLILFIWTVVLLFLICILIDYLYSRKTTK